MQKNGALTTFFKNVFDYHYTLKPPYRSNVNINIRSRFVKPKRSSVKESVILRVSRRFGSRPVRLRRFGADLDVSAQIYLAIKFHLHTRFKGSGYLFTSNLILFCFYISLFWVRPKIFLGLLLSVPCYLFVYWYRNPSSQSAVHMIVSIFSVPYS